MGPNQHIDNESTDCQRCGTCCRKGGPCLHLEDQPLVQEGKIPLSHIFTIRRGEPAYDNVTERLGPAETDILKIRGPGADTAPCIYYRAEGQACDIYPHRPLECRLLSCRQPETLVACYNRDRLTREHLLAGVPGLWDLVLDHQNRCDYGQVGELAERLGRDRHDSAAEDQLLEIIRYDHFLRQGITGRSTMTSDMIDFFLGRPLAVTLGMFQLKLVRKKSELSIRPFV